MSHKGPSIPMRTIITAVSITVAVITLPAASDLDSELMGILRRQGFSGAIEATLDVRLGRPIDRSLADLGRVLFFDKIAALRGDNACAGCHAPTAGFGDTQSIAIGIQNNNIVGQNRRGPRNQRRTPTVINTAFFPKLMWNGRFFAPSDDPFDNSQGFVFPMPEGTTAFPPHDPIVKTLLAAQAHIPPTELVEVAGFTGTTGTIGRRFDQFDDGIGEPVPMADESGFRNEPIRQALLTRLNGSQAYRKMFGERFPDVGAGGAIDFSMFARAIAEFEFTLVLANAPIDRFARGDRSAMTLPEKKGALLFFGEAGCVHCHAVAGRSNEMFSDFRNAHDRCTTNRAAIWNRNRQHDLRRSERRRGLRPRAGHRRSCRSLSIPDLASAQCCDTAVVLPQWRVHASRGRDSPSPECARISG